MFKPPRNITELRSFLGLCKVYRQFVPNFARVAAPFTARLRKAVGFRPFNEAELLAMEELKRLLY